MNVHVPNLSLRPIFVENHGRPVVCLSGGAPYREDCLDEFASDMALKLFRRGNDTVEIARLMDATQAAVANGIAGARERERSGQ